MFNHSLHVLKPQSFSPNSVLKRRDRYELFFWIAACQ
jgi:hypothetical protein